MLGERAVLEKSQICVTSFIDAPNLQGYALLDLQWGSEHPFSNGRLQGRCGMAFKNQTPFHNWIRECPVSNASGFQMFGFRIPTALSKSLLKCKAANSSFQYKFTKKLPCLMIKSQVRFNSLVYIAGTL